MTEGHCLGVASAPVGSGDHASVFWGMVVWLYILGERASMVYLIVQIDPNDRQIAIKHHRNYISSTQRRARTLQAQSRPCPSQDGFVRMVFNLRLFRAMDPNDSDVGTLFCVCRYFIYPYIARMSRVYRARPMYAPPPSGGWWLVEVARLPR